MTYKQPSADSWLEEVAMRMEKEKKNGNAPNAECVTVREFLRKFGNERRGQNVVGTVKQALKKHKLRTSPDFIDQFIDDHIFVELVEQGTGTDAEDPTVRVRSLAAAHRKPVTVKREEPLERAITIMLERDYSQLPVISGNRGDKSVRHDMVKGVVTWRSIGVAFAKGQTPKTVGDCMDENVPLVHVDTTLIEAMNRVEDCDYILIRSEDGTVSGIVTSTDLGREFRNHAQPFLWIGEIEQRLRSLVRDKFNVEEFSEASIGEKTVEGPDDLTLGGFCKLLERVESWERMNSPLDRKRFIDLLNDVREIRNEIMHFSTDELEQESLRKLGWMLRLLREDHRVTA